MATLYTHIGSNIFRTWLLMGLFFVFIIGLGWVFSQIFGNPSILVFAVAFSMIMNIVSYWYSDKIALAISRAKPIEKKDNPELYRLVENLCITAGLPLPKIYIMQEAQPNAFATGRDKDHAVIAVTRGLLEKLDKSETEGVISHELSHIGNRDILLMTMVVVLVGFVSLVSDWFLRTMMWGGFRSRGRGEKGNILPLVGIILAIVAPIAAVLIQLAISRKREFLADASGALLTRYPEGLASALAKIASDKTPLKAASSATSHLYISNPFRGHSVIGLFSTHPPIEERIRRLREMQV